MPRRLAACVITFGRPQGLGNLLAHLETQRGVPEEELHVVVVDNNPDRSAAGVVQAARDRGLDVAYAHEPVPGIPRARNRSVELALESGAAWLCFIDDDETPVDDWLARLTEHAATHQAPVVTGPVLPVLPAGSPSWLATSRLFTVRRYPTGTRRDRAFTGNVIVDRRVFESMDRWFDESMSLTGGSDTEFFRRVHEAGFGIEWCDEAVAYEEIPAERCTLRWIGRRNFRQGLGSARFTRRFSTGWAMVKVFALAVLRLLRGAALAILTLGLVPSMRLRVVENVASGAGLLLGSFGLTIDEYRRPSALAPTTGAADTAVEPTEAK